jgi:hypothetical protein
MDQHTTSWAAAALLFGSGYFAGAASVCFVFGLLRTLRWVRAQQGGS